MTDRRIALNTLNSIAIDGAYANLALNKELSVARPTDVSRVTSLVYSTIEHLNHCDFIINHYAQGRVQPQILNVLRLGVSEMLFMNTPAYAACSESVLLVKEIGKAPLSGFVNGVLRSIARDFEADCLPQLPEKPVERFNTLYGYPKFIIEEYLLRYGETFTEKLLSAGAVETTVRAVTPFTTSELTAELRQRNIRYEFGKIVHNAVRIYGLGGSVKNDKMFSSGLMTVQSESAMLVCHCLDVKPHMNVLDCCAAPGGKTAYLSELMENSGRIEAWDIHEHRVGIMRKTLERLHVNNVSCSVRDASVIDPSLVSSFDAVLCDVPCSGLGGGSKPDARYNRNTTDIEQLAELQFKILSACSVYVIPGGALVYSTCTVSKRENEDVIERFIASNAEFRLDSLERFLPEEYSKRCRSGMLQLFRCVDNTDGFFIARMVRG